MATFQEKFGAQFDPERQKLKKGMKFTLVQVVEITESLKKDKDGETYRIASINGEKAGKATKYYTSNKAIVNQIEQNVIPECDDKGTLPEPVEVTVVEKISGGGFKYLALE